MSIFTPDNIDSTVEKHGFTFTVETARDDGAREPWNECDGHGTVTDWTTCEKLPGQRVMCEDSRGSCGSTQSRRYYDWQDAVKTARAEKWGSLYPYKLQMSKARNGAWIARATADAFINRNGDYPELTATRRDINRAISDVYAMRRAQFPTARAYHTNAAEADFQRLRAWCEDEWFYVIVTVTVSRNGIELASDCIGGVESDGDIADIANDCACNAAQWAIDEIETHQNIASALTKLKKLVE